MEGQVLKTGRDYLREIGGKLYGEEFTIDSERFLEPYKKAYQVFTKKNTKQGLLVIGGIGTGKSAMMRVFQSLLKDTEQRFRLVNGYELRDMSEEMTLGEIKAIYGKQYQGNLYIDDIGISLDARRYGNTVNIIAEIIMERYDLFMSSGKRIKTHFSSNIFPTSPDLDPNNVPTLTKMYGKRAVDRLTEMCAIVIFKGKSLR